MSYPIAIRKLLTYNFYQKITFFEYLYVFGLIIYAGRANWLVQFFGTLKENPVGIFLPILLSGIIALKWKVSFFDTRFFYLISGLGIYFLAVSLKFDQFRPSFLLNYLFLFFIVYITVKALGFNLFRIYEHIIFYLAVIALTLWSIQIVTGGDFLINILSNIPGIKKFSYVSGDGLNAIVYSVQPQSTIMTNNFNSIIPRNCGFAWEPGGFAVYLCMAIFVNLFILNTDSKSKFRFWILLIALISTQSTTGYAIFTLIALFYYLNKKLSIILLLIPVMVTSMMFLFSLPFMSDKIVNLFEETNNTDQIVRNSINRENTVSPQRFTSFMISFRDFKNNPILGLGSGTEESWTRKINANISSISGIGNLLATFGIVGFLFFMVTSIQSSYFFAKFCNYKGKILLFLIILFITISYSIVIIPLLMCFWMFSYFQPQKDYGNQLYGLVLKRIKANKFKAILNEKQNSIRV